MGAEEQGKAVAYLRLRRDVAAGSMRPSSVAAVTPIGLKPSISISSLLRSNSSIAQDCSFGTGTPRTVPDAAQAAAAGLAPGRSAKSCAASTGCGCRAC